jgi:hypothetical protein
MQPLERDTTWISIAAMLAGCLPSLLAFNVAPSPTFLNQALALLTWGLWAGAVARFVQLGPAGHRWALRSGALPLALLALPFGAAVVSWLAGALPDTLALSAAGTLLAAALLVLAGGWSGAAQPREAERVFAAFCAGWVLSGLLNVAIAALQVFVPDLADGQWLAHSAIPGRAVGNLRQPNHVCTLLLWSAIAALALHEQRRMGERAVLAVLALLAFGLVLTASRTAVLGLALLALWGVVDRGLSRTGRRAAVVASAFFALAWGLMWIWASAAHAVFGGQQRLAEADLSASRFRIWSDTWQLIQAQPWQGVGFGEFNFAWSLSRLPNRPPAFFDHSHNLFLQWAVELGLPLAVLMMAILLGALWRIARAAWRRPAGDPSSVPGRAAFAMLVMIGLHSQLEYPLWYAYFLLPTAWLLGFGQALSRPELPPLDDAGPRAAPSLGLRDRKSVV